MAAARLKLEPEDFLTRYWQRQPLLISDAISGFSPPVSADELAGLAMEDSVESRIIELRASGWQVHQGPFALEDFQREPPWTLLVQAVDHYLPEVAALRKLVDFIPQWRCDDVMVSYASDGGSVGPHYDNYDVFLLQGEGERLWRLGQRCNQHTPLLPHADLRILQHFECSSEHLLRCGDILYVPPGVAHWGIAQGECTTFSIGFRAPQATQLLSRWVDQCLESLPAESFYTDPVLSPSVRPGELDPAAVRHAIHQLQALLATDHDPRWFGELVTEPRYERDQVDGDCAITAGQLRAGSQLVLEPAAKLAWQEQDDNSILVFVNGRSDRFPAKLLPLVQQLCEHCQLATLDLDLAAGSPALDLLHFLLGNGGAYVEDD